MNYRNDLQSVRFFSMIYVFYFHKKKKYFRGGFIGVDIFFALSGYFITGSLIRRMSRNKYYVSFYKGRIQRLQPMSHLLLLLIYFSSLTNPFISYKISKVILSCLYSCANYYFYIISVNYFEQSNKASINPLLHFWSLSVENQFYLIWPFIIKLIKFSMLKYYLLVLFILSLSLSLYISYKNINYSYYAFEVRLCELIFGSYLKIIHNGNVLRYNVLYDLTIIIMWIYSNEKCSVDEYPGYKMVFPLITAFFILFKENNEKSLFSIKLFQYFGSMSYSFYLLHYPFIVYYRTISILLVLIVSILCYSLIESPIVKLNISNFNAFTISMISIGFLTYLQLKSYKSYIEYNKHHKKCASMWNKDKIREYACIYIDKSRNIRIDYNYILLIGDSHLSQWNNILLPIYQNINKIIIMFSFWINNFLNNKYLQIIEFIERIGKPYYVFESFYFNPNLGNRIYKITENLLYKNYKEFNIYLANISHYVIIIVDNPSLLFNPKIIYNSKENIRKEYCVKNINCTIDMQLKINIHNIKYINLSSHYCTNSICYLYKNGKEIYCDNHHLTDCFIYDMKIFIYKALKEFNIKINNLRSKESHTHIYHCGFLDFK